MAYQALSMMEAGVLIARAADLKDRIMAKLETGTLHGQLPRLSEVPSEGLLEEVKVALWTIPTATITEKKRSKLWQQ